MGKHTTKPAIIPADAIQIINGQPTTTSLDVAKLFSRQHKNIIAKIENLDCSPDFTSANFLAHEEIIQAGAVKRPSKTYKMTKDGFIFLVMNLSGEKAARMKEAYIGRFNRMEQELHQQQIRAIEQHYQQQNHDTPWQPLSTVQIPDDELAKYRMINKMAQTLELTGNPVILPADILHNLALPISGMLNNLESIRELEEITRHRVRQVFETADRNCRFM